MRNDFYPSGTVRALLPTNLVTSQTRDVLTRRLEQTARTNHPIFDDETFGMVEAVCDCLLPQDDKKEKIPLVLLLEEDLGTSKGKGWRYAALPAGNEAIMQGLKGIGEEAQTRYGKSFQRLSKTERVAVLTGIQTATAKASTWKALPAGLFFTELLALLTQLYYSHPFGKEEIGDASFADAKGWTQIGLNEWEGQEPRPFNASAQKR